MGFVFVNYQIKRAPIVAADFHTVYLLPVNDVLGDVKVIFHDNSTPFAFAQLSTYQRLRSSSVTGLSGVP